MTHTIHTVPDHLPMVPPATCKRVASPADFAVFADGFGTIVKCGPHFGARVLTEDGTIVNESCPPELSQEFDWILALYTPESLN